MGEDEATLFAVGEKNFAHLSPPAMDGTPSHWSSFLRVENVDASTKKAVANGGTEFMSPMDIPPGRFSVIATPSGASMCLFHESDLDGAEHYESEPGLIHWVELQSTDIDTDVKWLKDSFGFTTDEMEMPDGKYHILKRGDEMTGGVSAPMGSDMPSAWVIWFNVADVDATLEKATQHNGTILAPAFDIPDTGRMGVIQDPAGGVIGVMTPS